MKLEFGGQLIVPAIRRLYDLRDIIFDTAWFDGAPNRDVYYMYRDLSLTSADKEVMKRHKLRYDITIIPPLKMGVEFVKTLGHYHPRVQPEVPYTYPELYEVLDGEAHYLLQRRRDGDSVDDVLLVRAMQGDKVIVPPNYGHVTINPSEETLKMANWVCRWFEPLYEPYERLHGGAYYELVNDRLLPNRAYSQLPEIRVQNAVEVPDVGLRRRKPTYELIEEPYLLDFLVAPQEHASLFEGLYQQS